MSVDKFFDPQPTERRGGGAVRPYIKIATLVFLILILLIPLLMIDQLTNDRARSRAKAVAEIGSTWGRPQTLIGPILVIPIRAGDAKAARSLFVLPSTLIAKAALTPEERYRGIYRTTVYRTAMSLTGAFRLPDLAKLGIAPGDLDWEKAYVSLGIDDPRTLSVETATFAGRKLDFLAASRIAALRSGIHALTGAPDAGAPRTGTPGTGGDMAFSAALRFTGHKRLFLAPVGRDTTVAMISPWRHPAFGGRYLPTTRDIGEGGFEARWRVSHLGRGFPAFWTAKAMDNGLINPGWRNVRAIRAAGFGVSLVTPVDFYLKTERATKYGILLVVLVVAAIFIFEIVGRVRFHPIEYGLVGIALVLFFLLLLSFAEILGFAIAYGLAAILSVGAITGYTTTVLRSWRGGGGLGAMVAAAFGYGYVLLQLEDFSLAAGAVGLFAVLVAVMYVTRNIDWSTLSDRRARSEPTGMEPAGSKPRAG